MQAYLSTSEVVNWHHPQVQLQARQLAQGHSTPAAIANACFEWVRDEIRHSVDYQMNPLTWQASDVLRYKTGYCFAKSHLLAALLRANQIPAGFCYQRLSIDDQGAPYSLHGFNAVYLPKTGRYRIDPRGNKAGILAQFTPPQERLAYVPKLPGEADFHSILAEPLPIVVAALKSQTSWESMSQNLPDFELVNASGYGLVRNSSKDIA
jgi:transglutaminase-like putative cysteine protease